MPSSSTARHSSSTATTPHSHAPPPSCLHTHHRYMVASEVKRMHEAEKVIERDRYKSDEVIKQREKEYYALYEEIKRRVKMRQPLVEAEQIRQNELVRETKEVLEDPEADEEAKSRAMRKMLHDPFKDLDAFLTEGEMHELNELKGKPDDDEATQAQMQRLLLLATERRIEAHIDELLDREDDVLV